MSEPIVTPAAPAATPTPSADSSPKNDAAASGGGKKEGDNGKPPAPVIVERKVNGKVIKVTQEEWDRYGSLGLTAHERLQEAAKKSKDADAKLARLKTPKDAIDFLRDPENGYKPDEIRAAFEEWYKAEYIDPSKMTPDQKRIRELEAKVAKADEKEAAETKRLQDEEDAAEDKKTTTQLIEDIKTIIEEHKLPKKRSVGRAIAYFTRLNESKGIKAPPALIAQQVRNEARSSLTDWTTGLTGDSLVEFLGGWDSPLIKELRTLDIARARARRNGGTPPAEPPAPKDQKPREERGPKRSASMRTIWGIK